MSLSSVPLDPAVAVHLVGIGGAGMSGIARVLIQRGHRVSGSDLADGRVPAELRMLGARIEVGHDAGHLGDAELVVVSSAVPDTNPEVVAAHQGPHRVLRRAEMLAALMADQRAVLIAGTHGKTTTTSMAVVALQAADRDPSFAIGGSLNESGTNAHAGRDDVFVAEADESDRSFLAYRPDLAVVTNVELDHPDQFADHAAVVAAFEEFLARRPPRAPALVCSDDPGSHALASRIAGPVLTYGTTPDADVRIVADPGGEHRVRRGGEGATFRLGVPGEHNLLNAAAALAVCSMLEVDLASAAAGLARFTGATRRFQRLGVVAGVTVVDDYAHHPTELRATLGAARSLDPQRVVLLVQPHRYTRTRAFGAQLGQAAAAADLVVVTDVYGSSEAPVPGVSGRLVADAARGAGAKVIYEPHLADVVDTLVDRVRDGDLVLTTGAGDVTNVGPALIARLGGSP